jgi:hypothetical protein
MKKQRLFFKTLGSFINRRVYLFVLIGLISFQAQGQTVRVIDNKVIIIEIRNNEVIIASILPIANLENDIWINTFSSTVKVWENTSLNAWQEVAFIAQEDEQTKDS